MNDVTFEFTFGTGIIGHEQPKPKIRVRHRVRHPVCFTGRAEVEFDKELSRRLHHELDLFIASSVFWQEHGIR